MPCRNAFRQNAAPRIFAVLTLLSLAVLLSAPSIWGQRPGSSGDSTGLKQPAPLTRTDNVKDVVQGVEIVDPYRWLEDQNSPETRV